MKKPDGGLAFAGTRLEPRQPFADEPASIGPVSYPGMSLRDYFAAKALRLDWVRESQLNAESTAEWAYEVADAMIAEREK